MRNRFRIFIATAVAAIVAGPAIAQTSAPLAMMSCDELWFQRNQIYAEAGYCFRSRRGVEAFGRGCFAPFGRLNSVQRAKVDQIARWETRRRCPR